MAMPWMAINAATAMIAQSMNKEGFECMQRALAQKHVQYVLENRLSWQRRERGWLVEDGQSRYMMVTAVFLHEVDEYSWSFLHPYLIILPPLEIVGNNAFAVCAVAALNMGIAVHR